MKSNSFLGLSSGFLVLSIVTLVSHAQDVTHAPDGGTRETVASIFISPKPNAPFTATVKTEWIKALADGSTITVKNHRTVARDGAGRIFQERRYLTADDDTTQSRLSQLEFSNPASQEIYICSAPFAICDRRFYFPPSSDSDASPSGVSANGESSVSRETLGSNVIGGIDTIGTRETTTLAPGAIGNNRAIAIIKEFWYSSLLGLNILTKRIDPRVGTQTFLVTDINLDEPNPILFNLPQGAKIVDMRRTGQSGPGIVPPQN